MSPTSSARRSGSACRCDGLVSAVSRSARDSATASDDRPARGSARRASGPAGSTCWPLDGVLVRMMPPGSLEQVVFRMDALHRVAAAGVPVLNPPRAVEAAVDKYLTLALLEQAGIAGSRDLGRRVGDARRSRHSRPWGATWSSSRCSDPRDAA